VSDKPQAEVATTDLTLQLEGIKCGYVVALKDNGDLIFELIGTNQGVIETLGLHEYATTKINRPFKEMELEKINQSIRLIGDILSKMLTHEKAKIEEKTESGE